MFFRCFVASAICIRLSLYFQIHINRRIFVNTKITVAWKFSPFANLTLNFNYTDKLFFYWNCWKIADKRERVGTYRLLFNLIRSFAICSQKPMKVTRLLCWNLVKSASRRSKWQLIMTKCMAFGRMKVSRADTRFRQRKCNSLTTIVLRVHIESCNVTTDQYKSNRNGPEERRTEIFGRHLLNENVSVSIVSGTCLLAL